MYRRSNKHWSLWMLSGFAAVGLLASPHSASAADAPAANNGALSFSAGLDFTTDYFFRGILQENQGLIMQPTASISANVFKSDTGPINSIDLDAGTWLSLQSHKVSGTTDPRSVYETDYWGGASATFGKKWTLGSNYYALTSPNGGFGTVQELDTTLSYDDSGMYTNLSGGLLGKSFGLEPYAMFAVELSGKGHSSGGNGYGKYLELGISPDFTVLQSKTYPVTLSVPITLGLNAGNYYSAISKGEDQTFGYASVGTVLSMPLKFIPAKYGQWSAHVSGTYMWLNNDLARFNNDNGFQAIGTVGISLSY